MKLVPPQGNNNLPPPKKIYNCALQKFINFLFIYLLIFEELCNYTYFGIFIIINMDLAIMPIYVLFQRRNEWDQSNTPLKGVVIEPDVHTLLMEPNWVLMLCTSSLEFSYRLKFSNFRDSAFRIIAVITRFN